MEWALSEARVILHNTCDHQTGAPSREKMLQRIWPLFNHTDKRKKMLVAFHVCSLFAQGPKNWRKHAMIHYLEEGKENMGTLINLLDKGRSRQPTVHQLNKVLLQHSHVLFICALFMAAFYKA
jgi:hypothetical protein